MVGAKAPSEPVPAALGNPLAVNDNLELTGLTRHNDGFNVEALLDEDHETRDFGLVVLSPRAVNDLGSFCCPITSWSHPVVVGFVKLVGPESVLLTVNWPLEFPVASET